MDSLWARVRRLSYSHWPELHQKDSALINGGMFLNVKPLVSHSKTSPNSVTAKNYPPLMQRLHWQHSLLYCRCGENSDLVTHR